MDIVYLAVLALAFLACAAAMVLLRRLASRPARLAAPDGSLPCWFGWAWYPANLLCTAVTVLCPARVHEHLRDRLAAADLDPRLEPARWLSMSVITSLAAASAMGSACMLADLPAGAASLVTGAGFVLLPQVWLARVLAARRRRIVRELPAYLDLLTLSVEAGAALAASVRLIVERAAASPLRSYFERVLREIRGGRTRAEAFSMVARLYAVPALTSLATALAHGEATGMSLGSVLRAQGAQRTAERFAAAEKLAMQAPVKLLGPLILCIFPCTFIVLAVPVLVRLKEAFAP